MKKSKTATAVVFLTVLSICFVLVLAGVVRVGLGLQRPVALSYYRPGEEGVTYSGVVEWVKDTCRAFCTTELPGREMLTEANASINRAAGKWIFESTDPEVVRLNNGYLESVGTLYYYMDDSADKVSSVRDFVEHELGVPFLYVQAPDKSCQLDRQLPLEEMSNFNREASWLLRRLEENGVDYLDLRETLHADGLDHYDCFYVTDHHWTMETGLWAARAMAEELNGRYDLGMDVEVLDPAGYTTRAWEDAFLGSQGRKVTLSFAEPEDFTLPTPDFETSLRLTVPTWGTETSGDFDILYDEDEIVSDDYYRSNSYGAVMMGDCPYVKVENLNDPDGPVVAVLRESFAIAPGPYLALAAGELHLLDARYYNGSIKEQLLAIQPDVVVSLLNVQCHTGAYFDLIK